MNTDNYKVYCICDNCNKNTEVRDKGYMPSGWYEMVVNLYETETKDPTNYWSVILCDKCLVISDRKNIKVISKNLFSWLSGYLKI